MRTSDNGFAFPECGVDDCRRASSPIDVQIIGVIGEDFGLASLQIVCIDENATSVKVAVYLLCHIFLESVLVDAEPYRSCALFCVVVEPLERGASTSTLEKAEFAGPYDLQRLVADLKLTSATTVVTTST